MLRNHTLSAMDTADLAALLPHLAEDHVERGTLLTVQGGTVDQLYFPTTAFLAHTVSFEDGRSALTFIMGAEGVSGLAPFLAEEVSAWGVEVKSSGALFRLSAPVLRRQMEVSPTLRRQLLRLSYDYQAQTAYGVGCASLHSAGPRIASLILRSADRLGADELRLTQQDVAEFLGIQRTTVNAAAIQLKDSGAIHYSRGAIHIIDREALTREACECYGADLRRAAVGF